MKLKRYISRKNLLKLALFLAIAGGAWLFDYFHEGDNLTQNKAEHTDSGKATDSFLLYFNPGIQTSLKMPVAKPSLKEIFYETENKFILKYHSSRAYHMLEAEPLIEKRPLWLIQHALIFRPLYSANPDELPATSRG